MENFIVVIYRLEGGPRRVFGTALTEKLCVHRASTRVTHFLHVLMHRHADPAEW